MSDPGDALSFFPEVSMAFFGSSKIVDVLGKF